MRCPYFSIPASRLPNVVFVTSDVELMLDIPSGFTTTASAKGTLRYSSKELLEEGAQSTTMSDVYAFGMLILRTSPNFPSFP